MCPFLEAIGVSSHTPGNGCAISMLCLASIRKQALILGMLQFKVTFKFGCYYDMFETWKFSKVAVLVARINAFPWEWADYGE